MNYSKISEDESEEEYFKIISAKLQINKNTPNDVKRNPEKYPDFPKQSEGISDIEHSEAISSYWKKISLAKKKKEYQENMKRITHFYMFDNIWFESLQLWCRRRDI